MKDIFINYLFSKGFFVGEEGNSTNAIETLISLAKIFDIQIVSGHEMASKEMIRVAEVNLGKEVSNAFYKGFPESVRRLTPDQRLLDQLFHYVRTYGLGDFSAPGQSVFEEIFERKFFNEKTNVKKFKIISQYDAELKLEEYMAALLCSTRPLNDEQYMLLLEYIYEYNYEITHCACKDTVVRLLLDTRDEKYATLLALSDVIRLVEQMQFECYGSTNVKKLNLINKDRVFLTKVLDFIFRFGNADVVSCFEKKKIWSGLLHHIHYKPINKQAKAFLHDMHGSQNLSVYSAFEALIREGNIVDAAKYLAKHKGSAAVLRNLNYLLSRCHTEEEIAAVVELARSKNVIVLIQLLIQYSHYRASTNRTFKFTKFNRLRVHTETPDEVAKRQSEVPVHLIDSVCRKLREYLAVACKGKLGKVFIDDSMKMVALPIQENTSMGGVGVLPKGTRIPFEPGKKIRAFTYWEKVNDIDLSAIGITHDGEQIEFSWRTMYNAQSSAVTYSGDQTSGFHGGSEFFDIILPAFKEKYPSLRHLVFCDNVFSNCTFDKCICTAGYMMRDEKDSGEIFEPKTVESSFRITCDSRFAYLFGIDLERNEFVWLNIARDSNLNVAGASSAEFLLDYMDVTNVINLYDFATLLASEVVESPDEADVVFSDRDLTLKEGTEQIRSCDFEKVIALMNT